MQQEHITTQLFLTALSGKILEHQYLSFHNMSVSALGLITVQFPVFPQCGCRSP